ncbi:MAG: SH3 domain-containing protein [Bacillota bacterium]
MLIRKSLTACLVAAIVVLSSASAAAGSVIVNQPKVNLRSGPGTTYSKKGEVTAGTRLELIETKGDWSRVRLPDGGEAWVYSPLVDREPDPDRFFVITAQKANVRSGPGVSNRLLGSVAKGTRIAVLGARDNWVNVLWQGKQAWISGELGTVEAPPAADPGATPGPGAGTPPAGTPTTGTPTAGTPAAGSPAAGTAGIVIVNQPKVNLRSGPGTTYPKAGEVTEGTRLELIEIKGDWSRIRVPGGGEAWVYSPLVDREYEPNTLFTVTVQKANIRSGPTASHALLGSVTRGTSLPALGARGNWIRVSWQGKEAWISGDLGTIRALDLADLDAGTVPRAAEAIRGVTLRSSRSTSASAVVTVKAGTALKYLDSWEGWAQVTWNGKTGWVEGKDIKVYDQGPFVQSVNYTISTSEWAVTRYDVGRVKGSFVNLRSGPGTGYKKTGTLPGGRQFKIVDRKSGWYRVSTEKGESGWISASYATIVHTPQVRTVSVKAESPQRKNVVIQGSFGSPVVKVTNDGKTLAAWFQNPGAGPAKMDINTFDLGAFSVNDNGMRLDLVEKANIRVTQAVAGKITAVIETSVTGVTLQKDGKRETVSVSTLGYAEPSLRARADGKGVDVVIPGAVLDGKAAGSGTLVRSVRASADAQGVTVAVESSSWKRHIAKRSAGSFTVEFLESGLKGKTIVLDPGHGGRDPGAIGQRGLYEKEPNLKIALALKPLLEKAGAKVVLTRSGDSTPSVAEPGGDHYGDLASRVALVDSSGADLFLSIHNNSNTNRSKSGSTMYYASSSLNAAASRALSEALQPELVKKLGRVDNGVRTAEHFVSRTCPVPAAIAEVVFISNAEEESLLTRNDFCRDAATALYNGLKKYYS